MPVEKVSPHLLAKSLISESFYNNLIYSSNPLEIVIIDQQIKDYPQLIAQITPGKIIILLDPNQDGIKQITPLLSRAKNIQAVHIFSHAATGHLQLGNTWLSPATLPNYQADLTQWFTSIPVTSHRPDLLFYGCQFSGDQVGQQLIQKISELTGADVAASLDLTGYIPLGGDWDLEFTTGLIEATLPFAKNIEQTYQAVLALIEVTTTLDENDGIGVGNGTSLREAIIEANQNTDEDTIQLQNGLTYSLNQLTLPDENDAQQGDLDINNGTITIIVKDNGIATIDGNKTDRIFHLRNSANLTLSNLVITNGKAQGSPGSEGSLTGAGGGGGGGAGLGGAIFHEGLGTLTVKDSTFSNNQAIGGQGGQGFPNGGVFNGTGSKGGGNNGGTGGGPGMPGAPGGFGSGGGGGGGASTMGGAGGPGGFGGGGGGGGGRTQGNDGGVGGNGGFGGGKGGQAKLSGAAGGGGGAGLGGAIFVNSGQFILEGDILFENNSTQGGFGGVGAWGDVGTAGQGKGGAFFINNNDTFKLAETAMVNYLNNFASDSVNNSTDNDDIYSQSTSTPEIVLLKDSVEISDGAMDVDLGNTPLNTDFIQTFTIKNIGSASLILTDPPSVTGIGFSLKDSFDKTVLLPGAATTFQVKLDGSQAGNFTGNISFANDDSNENPYNFSIKGTVTTPKIEVSESMILIANSSADPIDFGFTIVGTPVIKTFQIKNTGTADLTLKLPINLNDTGFSLASPFGVTTLLPGETTTFQIQLDALTGGDFNGKVTFSHNDTNNSPFTFIIQGTVLVGAQYASMPALSSTLSFGGTPVGTARTLTLDIKEVGDLKLDVDFIGISGDQASEFALIPNPFPLTIEDGAPAQTVTLQCTPSQAGQRTAVLELSSNDRDHTSITYHLKCQGISPVDPNTPVDPTVPSNPTDPSNPVDPPTPPIPRYSSTPAPNRSITMGSSLINQPRTQTLQIQEQGNTTLKVNFVAITGSHAQEFSLLNTSFPLLIFDGDLPPAITIQCLPAAEGERTAFLELSSNDPDYPTITYPLTCFGKTLPTASYASIPSPSETIAVGQTPVGVPVTHTWFIAEQGDADLQVNLVGITGIHAQDFSITNPIFPIKINNGAAKQSITVQCLPSAPGTRTAQLELQTNDPDNSSLTYPLTCQGIQAGYSSSLVNNTLDFGQALIGAAVTQSFDIIATGHGNLEVNLVAIEGESARDFTLISPTFPLTVTANGAAQTLTFQCIPTATGLRMARLQLQSSDPLNALLTYTLTCQGVADTAIYSSIPPPSQGIDLGSTAMGQAVTTELQIVNQSNKTLEVLTSQIIGTQAASFTLIQGAAPFSLAKGSSVHHLEIQCLPWEVGNQTAQLLFTTNDPKQSTVTYPLTCTSLAPVNHPPVNILLSQSQVAEDAPGGTLIGDFTTVDSDDQSHNYTLLDSAGGSFVLQGEQLYLSPTAQLDFETIPHYHITVRSTDSAGLFLDQTLLIQIDDVYEAQFLGKLSNADNTQVGKRLSIDAPELIKMTGYLRPSLKHIGQLADIIMTYHWTPDSGGQTSIFPITVAAQQRLQPDMEISLFKGYFIGLAGQFAISLGYQLPQNELISAPILSLEVRPNRLPTNIELSNQTVVEFSPNNTLVGAFTTIDADNQDQFDYGLIDPSDYFKIVGNELRVNYPLPSIKTKALYPITVRSVDKSGGYLEKQFVIQVTDAKTQPREIHLTHQIVFENSLENTIVGRLWTIDPEPSQYSYELIDNAQGRFKLVGDLLLVAKAGLLDYETQPRHTITVRAWKREDASYLTATFTIELLNKIDVQVWGEVQTTRRAQILDPTNLPAADDVKVTIHLVPEQTHQGKPAELISVAVWKPLVDGETRMYRQADKRWIPWNGDFANLLSNQSLTLNSHNELTIWQGQLTHLSNSEVELLVGYQLTSGEVVYSRVPFIIRVH